MFFVLIVTVPVVLLLVWAVVHDLRRRRAHDPLTAHDPRGTALRTRIEGEDKGTRWGAG